MANNRMWLVNSRNGQRVLLAKYFPSTGWYGVEAAKRNLDRLFDNDPSPMRVASFGSSAFRIEYETTEAMHDG